MLHELVFSGCHSQFAAYPPYNFAPYSYGCTNLQPYVAAAVGTHSDAVLSSTGAPLMETVIKIIVNNKRSTFASVGFGCRIHVNQPLELQTKNAIEIVCSFRESIIGDLQLSSWKNRGQQDYEADRKNPEARKN